MLPDFSLAPYAGLALPTPAVGDLSFYILLEKLPIIVAQTSTTWTLQSGFSGGVLADQFTWAVAHRLWDAADVGAGVLQEAFNGPYVDAFTIEGVVRRSSGTFGSPLISVATETNIAPAVSAQATAAYVVAAFLNNGGSGYGTYNNGFTPRGNNSDSGANEGGCADNTGLQAGIALSATTASGSGSPQYAMHVLFK